MKLQFKQQAYQSDSVKAVLDCFAGQTKSQGFKYAIDPGRTTTADTRALPGFEADGFANEKMLLPSAQLLANLHTNV